MILGVGEDDLACHLKQHSCLMTEEHEEAPSGKRTPLPHMAMTRQHAYLQMWNCNLDLRGILVPFSHSHGFIALLFLDRVALVLLIYQVFDSLFINYFN